MPEKGLKRATLVALFFLLYLKAKFSLIKRIFLWLSIVILNWEKMA